MFEVDMQLSHEKTDKMIALVLRQSKIISLLGLIVFISACQIGPAQTTQSTVETTEDTSGVSLPSVQPSETDEDLGASPSETDDPTHIPSVEPTQPLRSAEDWMNWPVIPELTDTAIEIYLRGLESGNDPRHFSKVGDCQNVPSMFLSIFDTPGYFSLGEYEYLQTTIEWYEGSYSRESQAVRRGFNAASIVSPFWANPEACESGETPLECEFRLHQPSIAIISLETWWDSAPENYEKYVREIIEATIALDVVPILATKADNLEGEHQINFILASLAVEYDIPVWNFWAAVQPLPNHGLMDDDFHLTWATNYFDDSAKMRNAWPWRNLTALQVLDSMRTALDEVAADQTQ
jgi:hypothetical protein